MQEELETALNVAPFAGAWIEIDTIARLFYKSQVAPFAGAWIEIFILGYKGYLQLGRTLRGCVD